MDSSDAECDPEETDLGAEIGRKIEELWAQTPTLTSPIGCSTEIATNTAQPDQSGTQIPGQETNTAATEQKSAGKPGSKLKFEVEKIRLKLN